VPTVVSDDLYDALAPLLGDAGFDLVDVEVRPGQICAFIDRPGGVDLDAVAGASRIVSTALDELDPFEGRYTLEVSSPGLERRLRRPEHFARAAGETVTVRTLPGTAPARRLRGRLAAADHDGFVLEGPEIPDGSMRFSYAEVERVRTVFEWGAASAPGPGREARGKKAKAKTPPTTGDQTERVTTP
jgi:ribosome maturation factor RimP